MTTKELTALFEIQAKLSALISHALVEDPFEIDREIITPTGEREVAPMFCRPGPHKDVIGKIEVSYVVGPIPGLDKAAKAASKFKRKEM